MGNNEILVRFTLGDKKTYLDANIAIPSTGVTAIIGDSGSGKTSLLRCIAGLEKPKNGFCSVNGEIWQDQHRFVETHNRNLGYVFQEASLFSHLSARGNLDYGQKRSGHKKHQAFFDKVIDVLGIGDVLERYPQQLSGGERQRVAIARALLIQPKLLLMDEPLASLDKSRKQEILPYLERLAIEFQLPILYVTHSMAEVIRLADYGLIMQHGKVLAQGSIPQLFSDVALPLSENTELGAVLECEVVGIDTKWSLMEMKFTGGSLWLANNGHDQQAKCRVQILASDISVFIRPPEQNSILNTLEVVISQITNDNHPSMMLLTLQCGSSQLIARLTKKSVFELALVEGKKVWAMIKSAAIVR